MTNCPIYCKERNQIDSFIDNQRNEEPVFAEFVGTTEKCCEGTWKEHCVTLERVDWLLPTHSARMCSCPHLMSDMSPWHAWSKEIHSFHRDKDRNENGGPCREVGCDYIYGLAKGCKLEISIKSLVLSPLPVHWGFPKPKTQCLNGTGAVNRTPGHRRLTENHQKFLEMASGGWSVWG